MEIYVLRRVFTQKFYVLFSKPGGIQSLVALVDFNKVHWSLIPAQLPVFASMVFVVAFSSCLDVAAIEMDIAKPLDPNSELGEKMAQYSHRVVS